MQDVLCIRQQRQRHCTPKPMRQCLAPPVANTSHTQTHRSPPGPKPRRMSFASVSSPSAALSLAVLAADSALRILCVSELICVARNSKGGGMFGSYHIGSSHMPRYVCLSCPMVQAGVLLSPCGALQIFAPLLSSLSSPTCHTALPNAHRNVWTTSFCVPKLSPRAALRCFPQPRQQHIFPHPPNLPMLATLLYHVPTSTPRTSFSPISRFAYVATRELRPRLHRSGRQQTREVFSTRSEELNSYAPTPCCCVGSYRKRQNMLACSCSALR